MLEKMKDRAYIRWEEMDIVDGDGVKYGVYRRHSDRWGDDYKVVRYNKDQSQYKEVRLGEISLEEAKAYAENWATSDK